MESTTWRYCLLQTSRIYACIQQTQNAHIISNPWWYHMGWCCTEQAGTSCHANNKFDNYWLLSHQLMFSPPNIVRPLRRKGTRQTKGYWGFAANRRQFLVDYAQKMGFDPMHAENWQFRASSIRQLGVPNFPYFRILFPYSYPYQGRGLLQKYKGSIQALIQDTLEEVSFEKGKSTN